METLHGTDCNMMAKVLAVILKLVQYSDNVAEYLQYRFDLSKVLFNLMKFFKKGATDLMDILNKIITEMGELNLIDEREFDIYYVEYLECLETDHLNKDWN